jgi:hypothetical protein
MRRSSRACSACRTGAAAHRELARLSPSVVEPLGAGIGGETRFAFARAPRLDIGPLTARDLVVGRSVDGSLSGRYYDALLGARFLQRYRVTFDYPHRQIIFEPNPAAEPETFDRSGAYVVQDLNDAHRFTVHAVAAGSPAEQAGVVRGDVLLIIAGLPAAGLTLNTIRANLSVGADQPVEAVVSRRGRKITTSLHLRDLI